MKLFPQNYAPCAELYTFPAQKRNWITKFRSLFYTIYYCRESVKSNFSVIKIFILICSSSFQAMQTCPWYTHHKVFTTTLDIQVVISFLLTMGICVFDLCSHSLLSPSASSSSSLQHITFVVVIKCTISFMRCSVSRFRAIRPYVTFGLSVER